MTFRQFFIQLFLVSFLSVAVILALENQFVALRPHVLIGWWTLTLFSSFSIMLFMWGKNAIESHNKYLFSTLTLASVLIKMLLGLALVIVYKKIKMPTTNAFVVPFFLIYVAFTIFETWFMVRLTKPKE